MWRWYIRPLTPALGGNILKADVLWCRGARYGAASWARRNTPMFAGGSRRARGSRVSGPWPTSCLACVKGRVGGKTGQRRGPSLAP